MSTAPKLLPGESLKLRVRFGSPDHPQEESVAYARPADDERFHFVRRLDGNLARIHDSQVIKFESAVVNQQAAQNVFPQGRW